jgi:hypothetical protein
MLKIRRATQEDALAIRKVYKSAFPAEEWETVANLAEE